MKSLKKDSKSWVSEAESSGPAVEMQKEPTKNTQRNMAMNMGLDIWEDFARGFFFDFEINKKGFFGCLNIFLNEEVSSFF